MGEGGTGNESMSAGGGGRGGGGGGVLFLVVGKVHILVVFLNLCIDLLLFHWFFFCKLFETASQKVSFV